MAPRLRLSSARKSGWAIEIRASPRSRSVSPCRVDGAELGDDPMRVAARGHDPGARPQAGHDARHRAARCGRRQRDDRLAAARARRAVHEIHLAADARVDRVPDRVGADLAGKVDLDCRIDRGHAVVLADDRDVIRAIAGMELDQRVVVDEVVEAAGAGDERGNRAPGMDSLEPIGDDAALDQIDQPIGKHLGVDAELVLVGQPSQDSIRNPANPQLQRRAVLDEAGDQLADAALDCGFSFGGMLVQRTARPDERVHAIDRHRGGAVRARHAVVDLGDDDARVVDGRTRGVHRRAERAQAVAIGWRQGQEDRVERDAAAREQTGDLRQEDRDEVGAALGNRLAYRGADEERYGAEPADVHRIDEGRRSRRVQMIQRDVLEVSSCGQRLEERRRRCRSAVHENPHAAANARHGVRGGDGSRFPLIFHDDLRCAAAHAASRCTGRLPGEATCSARSAIPRSCLRCMRK